MRRIIFVIAACLYSVFALHGQTVGYERAKMTAEQFFRKGTKVEPRLEHVRSSKLKLQGESKESNEEAPYFIFNNSQGGFVVVSNNEKSSPIVAYSYEGEFRMDDLPDNILHWLKALDNTLQPKNTPSRVNNVAFSDSPTPVVQMETALWDQGAPFNDKCPAVNGVRCVTGCVATATAIIMRYHKWPEAGTGTLPDYTGMNGISYQGHELGHKYDWENMPLTNGTGFSNKERDAVSTLMWDCGVLAHAYYGAEDNPYSTGAHVEDVYSLLTYMDYDKSAHLESRTWYSLAEWNQMIIQDLSEERPILFSGWLDPSNINSGHAFVADGYDSNGFIHINWGWGGNNNCYISLEPYGNATEVQYMGDFLDTALFGLKPNEGGDWNDSLYFFAGALAVEGDAYEIDKPFVLTTYAYGMNSAGELIYFNRGFNIALLHGSEGGSEDLEPFELIAAHVAADGSFKEYVSDVLPFREGGWWKGLTCTIHKDVDYDDRIQLYFRRTGKEEWHLLKGSNRGGATLCLKERITNQEATRIYVTHDAIPTGPILMPCVSRLMRIYCKLGTEFLLYDSAGMLVAYCVGGGSGGYQYLSMHNWEEDGQLMVDIYLSELTKGRYKLKLQRPLDSFEFEFTL